MVSTSPELPFVMHGGDTKDVALYNRVAAINRMNYLIQKTFPSFDIRTKSETWLRCWELEMYKRFYVNDPKHVIDEQFCQNGALVAIQMEEKPEKAVDKREYFEAFIKSAGVPKVPEIKKGFMQGLVSKIMGEKNV